jgi:hypothetical protein
MHLVALEALLLTQVTGVRVLFEMTGGSSQIRIVAMASQALLFGDLQLAEWHEIALSSGRDELVHQIGRRS